MRCRSGKARWKTKMEIDGAAGGLTIGPSGSSKSTRRRSRNAPRRILGHHPPRDKEHHLASPKCRRERTPETQAESLGLIVTELVMNALKHAFPDDKAKGRITVAYDMIGTNWKLSISDNGIGKPEGGFAQGKSGLGTGIVKALAHQLDAQVETLAGPEGTTVSITHATFPAKAVQAA
jgi:anti-sigma regulatory factor (Ser/Thr protein kinase)